MVNKLQNEYFPSEVSPPGETLRELLAERGISQAALARRMGRPKKTINEILNAKAAITPKTALEFELVLGVPAEFWITRERNYRTHLARKEQEVKLKEYTEWSKKFPLNKMISLGWLPKTQDPLSRVKSLLEFFGVASPEEWRENIKATQAAFRKSTSLNVNKYALSAWLRAGISHAESLELSPYNQEAFLEALDNARRLTRQPPNIFQPELMATCAAAGVAVAFIPELPKSRVSGATMWLSAKRALIQLSLRYKKDDHLWFTFFHEAAHIILHNKSKIFFEIGKQSGNLEDEANSWAANFLIPPDKFKKLTSVFPYSKNFIKEFAAQLNISPGIVVGRLQYEELLPFEYCNDLKRTFEWASENN